MMFDRSSIFTPIVAMSLLVLVGCSSGATNAGAPNVHAQSAGSQSAVAMCQPDFTLTLSPASATITSGQSVRVSAELASLCGLAGTINTGIHNISPPPNGNGFTIKEPRYDIPLDANSTAVDYITLGATPNTLKTTYTLTIQGEDVSGGCCYGLKHSATFELTVK
jgi:hypothetical protein